MDSYKSGNSYDYPNVKLKLQRNYTVTKKIRQDEKQTIAEKLKEMGKMEYYDFMEEYEKLITDTDADIEIESGNVNPFYCTVNIITDDGTEQIYLPQIVAAYNEARLVCECCYKTIDDTIADQEFLYNHKSQQMCCATYPLNKIKEQIISFEFLDKEGLIDKENNNFYYLFINPRKEVVEWALKNKEYFCSDNLVQKFFIQGFVEENQVNPELKELVLNELKQ